MSDQQKLEAFEWFFYYVQSSTNPTIEGAVEILSDAGEEAKHKEVFIALWEKQHAPYKWSGE